MESYQIIRSY